MHYAVKTWHDIPGFQEHMTLVIQVKHTRYYKQSCFQKILQPFAQIILCKCNTLVWCRIIIFVLLRKVNYVQKMLSTCLMRVATKQWKVKILVRRGRIGLLVQNAKFIFYSNAVQTQVVYLVCVCHFSFTTSYTCEAEE